MRGQIPIDPQKIATLIDLYVSGLSGPETASATGLSVPTVMKYVRLAGVERDKSLKLPTWSRMKTADGWRLTAKINGKTKSRWEHRVVMEEHLGRTLERAEYVHHKDRDVYNNDLGNLYVSTSSSRPWMLPVRTCTRCKEEKSYPESFNKVGAVCVACTTTRQYLNTLMHTYGFSQMESELILHKARTEGCEMCGERCATGRRLAFDHDKETGKFRGLLCQGCNTALGKLNHDPQLLRMAIRYLDKSA